MVIFQFAFCRFTTSHLETVNIHTTRLGPFKTGADWRCAIFASLIGLTTLPGFIIYIYIPHEQLQLWFPQNQLQNLNGKLNKGQKLTINCTSQQFCSSPCLAARRSWHCPRKCLPKAGWLDVFFWVRTPWRPSAHVRSRTNEQSCSNIWGKWLSHPIHTLWISHHLSTLYRIHRVCMGYL